MKSSFKALLGALIALLISGSGLAQSYPNKPVTLMVPYPAGGVSDLIARTLNATLAKHLGQPVVIENLGGASGGIAAQKLLNSPADGYVIFLGSPNELILAPLANAAVKYKSEDFRLVQMMTVNPLVMLARKDFPPSSVDQFLAYAKKAAAEGRPVTYASVGPGSMYHLLGEHLSKISGIEMTHVPYKGGAPAIQDLMGGQVDIMMTVYGKSYVQMVEEGKLKAPAVLSAERQESFNNATPLNDSKALRGFVFDMWAGFFVHKDTPEAIVQILHKALSDVANDPTIRAALEAQSMVVPRPKPLAEMKPIYVDNTTRYRAIAKAM